tara:strand:- start:1298 stop:1444 length:147 start_codon:yes stop_codon:yes gene_type:complete
MMGFEWTLSVPTLATEGDWMGVERDHAVDTRIDKGTHKNDYLDTKKIM